MVEKIDDLVLLLLRCDGKQAAIRTYEEETGANHARAVWAVEAIACKHGLAKRSAVASLWRSWQAMLGLFVGLVSAVSLLGWFSSGG